MTRERTNEHNHTVDISHGCARCIRDERQLELERRARAVELSGANIDEIVQGYLEAQLWTTSDDLWTAYAEATDGYNLELSRLVAERIDADELDRHGENLDEFYTLDEISSDYVEKITEELTDFVAAHPLAVRMYGASRAFDPSQGSVWSYFGHDLLLTRDGHGAGFWDRGLGELGEYLTKHARALSSSAYLFDGRLAVDPTSEPVLLADN